MGVEHLTLIERPVLEMPRTGMTEAVLAAGNLALEANTVVGIRLRERPPQYLHDYSPTGQETWRALPLLSGAARRLTSFFEAHMARTQDSHVHGVESIVRLALGMGLPIMHRPEAWPPIKCAVQDTNSLTLGHGYAILGRRNNALHYVYGIDDPETGLTTLGYGQALFTAPNQSLMQIMGGCQMGRITNSY